MDVKELFYDLKADVFQCIFDGHLCRYSDSSERDCEACLKLTISFYKKCLKLLNEKGDM